MRNNLTKKNIINSVYMQIGFSKKIIEEILNDIVILIIESIKEKKKLKITNFGTFVIKNKKSRPGYNFKTKQRKMILERNVVLFKPSKEFKNYINNNVQ